MFLRQMVALHGKFSYFRSILFIKETEDFSNYIKYENTCVSAQQNVKVADFYEKNSNTLTVLVYSHTRNRYCRP